LNEEYGDWSESYWNSALSLIRDAFDAALGDHVVPDNPVAGLTYRKRKKPIRTAPTFEQFKQIVADIRGQPFNRAAEDSGDFVEAMGLLGLGQAELASLKRSDVDLQSERLVAYRHKTDTGFVVPLFPQARPLIEKLCKGKKPHERLFAIGQARKAIASSCARLGFLRELSDGRMVAQYTHRSLRRMFIIRALERGINPQVVALWQGHKDGGKLILDTYSFVRREHERTMAALLTEREPAKVIPITTQA
jgi:Site-specific recombinase XerD